MEKHKFIIPLIVLLLSSNFIHAQGIFHVLNGLRGVRGDRSLEEIKPRIGEVEITDLNSLKDIPSISSERYVWYKGITAYNPADVLSDEGKIEKGLYT